MRHFITIAFLFLAVAGFSQVPMSGVGRPVLLPTDVDSLFYWFDASVGVTESGGAVSAWADQSGNGYDVSQGTAARKPTYSASGGLNNAPYITFDGANDFLFRSGIFWGADDFTIFAVIYNDQVSADTNDVIIGHWCSGCTDRQWVVGWSSLIYVAKVADGLAYTDAKALISKSADWKIISISAGGSLGVNKDGGVIQISDNDYAASIYNNTDSLVIGAHPNEFGALDVVNNAGNFSISEIIVFSSALTNAERQGIEAYLSSKYDLALENNQSARVVTNRIVPPTGVDSLFYWFKADAGVLDSLGGSISDGEAVSSWADYSGNGYDVTATGAAMPNYSATGGPNSLPAISFNGTSDYLASAAHWWGSDDLTVFVVMKNQTATRDATEAIVSKWGVTDSLQFLFHQRNASLSYVFRLTTDENGVAAGGSFANFSKKSTSYRVIEVVSYGSATNKVAWVNASSVTTSNTIGDNGSIHNLTQPLTIGVRYRTSGPSDLWFQGSISEIIVYSKALTPYERRLIETYLNDKYNLW